ncbi:MAG: GDP-mannose 4,6-dehydratase [Aigarchaeota archaeon]|nr:GDP-mannose 4,6-dehydratase [Aigarchaeota archaeon]MDW8093042.1 GDP-mannose 4,6-dehydratase [Nitrososphaerota archaeon]
MRVLVTGGLGFIGSHIVEYYLKKGWRVTILDNFYSNAGHSNKSKGVLYNLDHLRRNYGEIELVNRDVRSFDSVKEAAKDADFIFHTAAQVAVTTSLKDPRTDFETNALGTLNVLEAARLNDSAVVFCSTNKVYGTNINKIPVREYEKRYAFADEDYSNGIPETFPIDACWHSPYGCSKLAADIYVQDYAHTYGLRSGVFRLSCVYGERQFGVEDQGWLSWFVIATLTNRPITIYGDGKQVRDVLFVTDLIRAFDSFLASNLKHEVFNLGGGPQNTLSLLELFDFIEKVSGKRPRVSFADWRPADQKVYVSDIRKAERLLGWRPNVNPSDGVSRIFRWTSNNIDLFTES